MAGGEQVQGQRPLTHPALLRGHRTGRDLVAIGHRPVVPPPTAPKALLPETKRYWRMLWQSRVASAWDRESDLVAVTRYIKLLDRWLRFDALVTQAPLVRGSKDQLRANPLSLRMDAIEGQVRGLEEQLGLTPAARLRLGISLVEAQTVVDRYLADSEEREDPRAMLRREAAASGRTSVL